MNKPHPVLVLEDLGGYREGKTDKDQEIKYNKLHSTVGAKCKQARAGLGERQCGGHAT